SIGIRNLVFSLLNLSVCFCNCIFSTIQYSPLEAVGLLKKCKTNTPNFNGTKKNCLNKPEAIFRSAVLKASSWPTQKLYTFLLLYFNLNLMFPQKYASPNTCW